MTTTATVNSEDIVKIAQTSVEVMMDVFDFLLQNDKIQLNIIDTKQMFELYITSNSDERDNYENIRTQKSVLCVVDFVRENIYMSPVSMWKIRNSLKSL